MNRVYSFIVMIALALMTGCGGGGGGSSNSGGSGGGSGTVSGPPMSITTTTLPDAIAGKTYSAQLLATGGITPYSWALVTALPPGLTLNSSSGSIFGTLQSWGGDVTVVVQDSGSPRQSVTQKLSINLYAEMSIYTTSVPAGHTNVPYDFVLQSIDVKTWSITTGQLPPGLQLATPSRTQVEVKGTPSQKGSYTFTVQAQSISNPPQVVSKTYTLDVDDEPAVLNAQLLDVIRNQPYQDVLAAVNGTAPYHWSVQSGTLPAGITLDANTGVISGTMTTYETSSLYNVNFQVTDSSAPTRSGIKAISIYVVEKLFAGGGFQQFGTVGQFFDSYNNPSGGRPPYTWSWAGGTVPPGLTFGQGGHVSGMPTQIGDYSFTLHLQDSTNPPQAAEAVYMVKITPPVLTTPPSLPNRIPSGVAFSGFVAAQGGTPPYHFSLEIGPIPPGLQLNASTGELSGTPTTLGNYSFAIKVVDSGSPAQMASAPSYITVAAPLGRNNTIQKATPITTSPMYASISPYSDPVDIAGPDVDYYKLIVTNGTVVQINTYAKQGSSSNPLDTVLEVVDANGSRLNYCSPGPANSTGPFASPCLNDDIQQGIVQDSQLWLLMPGIASTQSTVYVKVSDWRGDARPDMYYNLFVNSAVYPLTITSKPATALTMGTNYSVSFMSTGGTGGVTWAVTAGNLPPGLTLSAGILSGTPTTVGSYAFTLTATDAGSPAQTATGQYTMQITERPKITSSPLLPDACLGKPYTFTMQYTGGLPPVQWTGYFDWSLFGINFDQRTATFSGVPTQTGSHTMFIGLVDSIFSFDNQTLQFTVKSCQ